MKDDSSLADALLAPHRSYLSVLSKVLDQSKSPIKALAHLTGGAFFDNIPRVMPENLCARVQVGSWPVLEVFELIQERGGIPRDEMYRVFNMGIGMVAVIDPSDVKKVQKAIREETYVIGEVCEGNETILV
jgi:phosphoribosylformylglycinamidine cyclo-ligase/phosphoribosylamine--glycine ligase/phosphoribosylformylglycinamidine cyclo-ligase